MLVAGPVPAGGGRFPGSSLASHRTRTPELPPALPPTPERPSLSLSLDDLAPLRAREPELWDAPPEVPHPTRGVTGRGRAAEPVCARRGARAWCGAAAPSREPAVCAAQDRDKVGKLAPCNRSPGGRFVLGALAAGSGSPVAEAPSALRRLPASSLRAQGREWGGVGSPEAAPRPGDGGAGSWPVPDLWGRESARHSRHPHWALLGLRAPPADSSYISLSLRRWRETPSTPQAFPRKRALKERSWGRPCCWGGTPQGLTHAFTPCNLPRSRRE